LEFLGHGHDFSIAEPTVRTTPQPSRTIPLLSIGVEH
jgi:hypothetical protein